MSATEAVLALVLAGVTIAAWAAYERRSRTLARHGRPVPAWRRACFAAGVVAVLAVLSPPADDISDQLFVAHMVQHLVLADIAGLLLVVGLTGPILAPLLRLRVVDRLRVLIHPGIAFVVWVVDFYAWHSPLLYQAALRSDLVHALEHACLLFFGSVLWIALIGPLPKPRWFGNLGKLIYIVVVRLAGTILANVFLWAGAVFYGDYAHGEHLYGISALGDQSIAGATMMVEESLLTIGLFCWLFLRAARESEERQELIELAGARDVALTEERAGRAVAAGRGAELRERLVGGRPT